MHTSSGHQALSTQTVVVGCQGGVGVTTLCGLLGPSASDAGTRVPRDLASHPWVLVTRSTALGAHRAVRAVAAARESGATPAAVAVVGDGPWPHPRAARTRLRMLQPRVGAVARVPYVAWWRYVDDPRDHPVPAGVTRAVARICAAVDESVIGDGLQQTSSEDEPAGQTQLAPS